MPSRPAADLRFSCPVTGAETWQLLKSYDAPPEGETRFGIADYRRDLLQDPESGHIVNRHHFDLSSLYAGDYWDQTYGGGRIATVFDKIMALPPDRSDNRARVACVDATVRALHPEGGRRLLDVGSGLAVFPAAMKDAGWDATALDPDPRSAAHARDKAGVTGIVADFMTNEIDGRYDLISFNKVLEHVPDPVAMLSRARAALAEDGVIYVELPDGEAAYEAEGPDREEFFVEHYCAFSPVSFALLTRKAGFRLARLERLVEPSGKYTLRGFLTVGPE